VLAGALTAAAATWAKVKVRADGSPVDNTRWIIARALAALVRLLATWSTPEGAELRRLAQALGAAADPNRGKPMPTNAPLQPTKSQEEIDVRAIRSELDNIVDYLDGAREAAEDAHWTCEDALRGEKSSFTHDSLTRATSDEFVRSLRSLREVQHAVDAIREKLPRTAPAPSPPHPVEARVYTEVASSPPREPEARSLTAVLTDLRGLLGEARRSFDDANITAEDSMRPEEHQQFGGHRDDYFRHATNCMAALRCAEDHLDELDARAARDVRTKEGGAHG